MFYGAIPITFERAKVLRNNMTNAEKFLWQYLKNSQINGLKFRRQHPINIFIADFYCHQAKLVIEVDGEIHWQRENHEWDNGRTAELENFGLKVIRFSNNQVLNEIEMVIEEIKKYL